MTNQRREAKGSKEGGRFAPDRRGKTPPQPPAQTMLSFPDDTNSETKPSIGQAAKKLNEKHTTAVTKNYDGEVSQKNMVEGAKKTVVIVRGIPGSGKSTWAKKFVQQSNGNTVRMNNDELAAMMFGDNAAHNPTSGKMLQKIRETMLKDFLTDETGPSTIIIDNTNLHGGTVNKLVQLAYRYHANVVLKDFFTTPVSVCKERNSSRERVVPDNVIDKMAKQLVNARKYVLPTRSAPVQRYHNDPSLPPVWIVDVDGTLALMRGRGPFEWDKVGQDVPNPGVVALVKSLIASGENVIIMSGRDGRAAQATQQWLDTHVHPGLPLHTRSVGDNRPDNIIKHELFLAHIADRHHVKGVLDDRDQVVHLWREGLGLPTFQVAKGDF